MVKQWFRCLLVFIVCCLLGWNVALAAVTAHVDRFNISEGETLNLSIEVSGDDSGAPQTAALQKDFEILSNSKSSSYSFINGSSSSKTTYELMLRPRHAGALTIPALKVGAAVTGPIMIQVSKMPVRNSQAGVPTGDVWIDMQVEPKQVLVQQQAVVILRIYQAVSLGQAQLSEPAPAHAIVERLGDDKTYQRYENNRSWQVTERRYAVFPQQSGVLDIPPVQLDGSVMVQSSSFFQQARPIRVRSNAIRLQVGTIPAVWGGSTWLPARKLHIEESWPQTATYTVGEPITRTLTITADGLTASQLPALSAVLPDHLKAYPDKAQLKDDKRSDGVHAIRVEKTALMPMQPGIYILPEIDLSWWNTATATEEHASIAARSFKVVAAAPARAAPLDSKPAAVQPAAAAKATIQQASGWRWLALFSSTGWLLTLAWLAYRRRRPAANSREATTDHIKLLYKAVGQACQSGDAKACEQALLQAARACFPTKAIYSLSALKPVCSEALQQEIAKLEQSLYAADAPQWQGAELWHACQQGGFLTAVEDKGTDTARTLPGLYPD